MTIPEKAAALVVFLVLVVLGLKTFGRQPALPAAVTRTADSLAASRPAFDSSVAVRLASAVRDSGEVRRLRTASRRAQERADAEKAKGDALRDSVARARTLADSAALWHGLADARAAESVELRQALDSTGAALAASEARGDSLGVVARVALERVEALTRLNQDLRASVAKITQCKFGGVLAVPCVSRRASFAGGVAVAGLAALAGR